MSLTGKTRHRKSVLGLILQVQATRYVGSSSYEVERETFWRDAKVEDLKDIYGKESQ